MTRKSRPSSISSTFLLLLARKLLAKQGARTAAVTVSLLSAAHPVLSSELPQGTNLEIRLTGATGSRVSHVGDKIKALVIAPVLENGTVAVPQGAILTGAVASVRRLGFGLKHATANIELHFNSLQLPGQKSVPLATRVLDVETAKERVNANGVIGGIHPVANLSSGVSVFISALLMQPGIAVPVLGVKFLIARSPDPEIYFPAGTEMIVQLRKSVALETSPANALVLPHLSLEDDAKARNLLAKLPQQQCERKPNQPSDLTNVMLLGKQDQIDRAFHAAGWSGAQPRNVIALYRMFHCAVQRNGYLMAPMARLKLNGVIQQAGYQKSLDTFAKRHHIRLWRQGDSDEWLSAATEDVSYGVRRMRLTHASDRNIDNERAKIVNDLAMTGCLDSATVVSRDTLHVEAAGTHAIVTDGKMAILRLNDCRNPANVIALERRAVPSHIVHITSVIGRDFLRSNPLSIGYNTTKMIFAGSHSKPETLAQSSLQNKEHGQRKAMGSLALLSDRWKRPSVLGNPVTLTGGYSSSGR